MSSPAKSLLLVDDDRVLRTRLARAFEDRGFDVTVAAGYDEAMAAARLDSPELAVVDLRMPGRSGLELTRDLLALDPTTRVVVLTGYGSITNAVEAMRLGATWYLPKPADADDVLTALERADRPPLEGAGEGTTAPTLERAKWEHIQRVLADAGGNISEAARRLGLHRRSLQRLLERPAPR